MALETDDRENLEPGMPGGLFSTPAIQSDSDPSDPFTGYEDYYGFDERDRWNFPDGKQWVEFKKLTEGDRAKYLKSTRADVTINQRSGDAKIPFDQSNDRRQLLMHSVTDWHIVAKNPKTNKFQPIAFGNNGEGSPLGQWLTRANPEILARIEKAIRMANPWLMSEMTADQIRKEIADLEELLKVAEEREAAEKNS